MANHLSFNNLRITHSLNLSREDAEITVIQMQTGAIIQFGEQKVPVFSRNNALESFYQHHSIAFLPKTDLRYLNSVFLSLVFFSCHKPSSSFSVVLLLHPNLSSFPKIYHTPSLNIPQSRFLRRQSITTQKNLSSLLKIYHSSSKSINSLSVIISPQSSHSLSNSNLLIIGKNTQNLLYLTIPNKSN